MQIKPVSNNLIEISQDNRSYEIMISDGLLRVKELRTHPKDDKIIFKQDESTSLNEKLSEKINLKENEILIISNHGDYVIKAVEWDSFQEDVQVSYGEEGKSFKTLLVVDYYNNKYTHESAEQCFTKDNMN